MVDIDQWLQDHGIDPLWGRRLALEIQTHYPHLYDAAKTYPGVECELELVDAIYQASIGKFPPHKIDPAKEAKSQG